MNLLDELDLFYKQREEWREATQADRPRFDKNQIAAAAVVVEASRADGLVDEAERATVRRLVGERLGLSPDDAEDLIQTAARRDYCWLFTDATTGAFAEEERTEIVETMLEVAYADGELHKLEFDIARRIANMLGLSDGEADAANERVRNRLGIC